MYREQIISALSKATLLILEVLKGECTIEEFTHKYGDFYYYEALDGHEADNNQKQVLDGLRRAIELHEKVQTEIVDLVYLGDTEQLQKYLEAGRISKDEAKKRLEKLSGQYNIEGIIKELGD